MQGLTLQLWPHVNVSPTLSLLATCLQLPGSVSNETAHSAALAQA